MAFTSGTAAGLSSLYSSLITFLTTTVGWTLHDTVAGENKVLTSVGSDSKQNLVFRLNIESNETYKATNNVHNVFDYIFVRGYQFWNAGTDTGSKEYGKWGPWLLIGPHNATTANLEIGRPNALPTLPPVMTSVDAIPVSSSVVSCFDGRRRIYHATGTSAYFFDLGTGENVTLASTGGVNVSTSQMALVHDNTLDKDFLYCLVNTATLADQLLRYDTVAETWTAMAAPTWTASSPSGGAIVWDGADTLYCSHGNSVKFAKYTISTNTWTDLTDAPASRNFGWNTNGSTAVYIPVGVTDGTHSVPGVTEDVIYIFLDASGNTVYRYDVTSNAWRSTGGTGALDAFPVTITTGSKITFDGSKYLYVGDPSNTRIWYRSDLTVAPNTFASVGTLQATTRTATSSQYINHMPGKIKGHAGDSIDYWIVATLDFCVLVTKVAGHYYWSYFGKFDTHYPTTNMVLSGAASPGSPATISVDSTTGYVAGSPVILVDPATGITEKTTIGEIVNGTSFKARITQSFTTGSVAGIDPYPAIATGDSWTAVTGLDAGGFESNYMAAGYRIQPMVDSATTVRSGPTVRGSYMLWPYRIYNTQTDANTYEERGTLKGIYTIRNSAFPAPQIEDEIQVGASRYKVFAVHETRNSTDNRYIAIGPVA